MQTIILWILTHLVLIVIRLILVLISHLLLQVKVFLFKVRILLCLLILFLHFERIHYSIPVSKVESLIILCLILFKVTFIFDNSLGSRARICNHKLIKEIILLVLSLYVSLYITLLSSKVLIIELWLLLSPKIKLIKTKIISRQVFIS